MDAVVCTADGDVSREVDKASRGNTTLKLKIMVGGARESWHCFNKDIQFFSANFNKTKRCAGRRRSDADVLYFGYNIVSENYDTQL